VAKKPKPPVATATEQIPSVQGDISAIASANAPLIFFDDVPNSGYYNGIYHFTLQALRFLPIKGTATNDLVIVAHLRMNAAGLASLKSAITNAELIAQKAASETKH